ncbi:MAG: hypothetical protein KDE53_22775 [Caldilineaceae bacterium]|nr:hypothetical protein [Caldilineaceae bacterium]
MTTQRLPSHARRRALWISAACTFVFAVAGNLLVGEPLSIWYAGLIKP